MNDYGLLGTATTSTGNYSPAKSTLVFYSNSPGRRHSDDTAAYGFQWTFIVARLGLRNLHHSPSLAHQTPS